MTDSVDSWWTNVELLRSDAQTLRYAASVAGSRYLDTLEHDLIFQAEQLENTANDLEKLDSTLNG